MAPKIGVIGAGVMLKYQAKGFRSAGAEITCIADTNSDAVQRASRIYNIPLTFNSANEMLLKASDEIDAVSIIVPPVDHKALTILALNAGKDVFCEKPPAMNAAEVKEMIRAAETSGRLLDFNFNNRIRPESLEIIKRIRSGFFGQVNSAQATWIRCSGIPGFGSWMTNKKTAGGGALIDLLHMVDLALYFMDYPEVNYVLGQTFNDFMNDPICRGAYGASDISGVTDVESAAHAMVTFKTGQTLTLHCSWAETIKAEECSVKFQGQKAGGMIIRLFGHDEAAVTISGSCETYIQKEHGSVTESVVVPYDKSMGRIAAAANFVKMLQGQAKPLITLDQAYRLMKIIDAVYLSATNGTPVSFSKN
jgi:predicted dehydrogenase